MKFTVREVREVKVKGKEVRWRRDPMRLCSREFWEGEMREKHGTYGNEGKYGMRKCRRKRKFMGRMGRRMWGSTLEEEPQAGMLKRIFGGKVRNKTIGKYWE